MTTGKSLSLFFYFCLLDLNQQSVYLHSLCGLLICIGAEAPPVADAARRRWSKTTSTRKGVPSPTEYDYVLIRMVVDQLIFAD